MARIVGTDFDDWLEGTSDDDRIYGRKGSDLLLGFGGDDLLYGEGGEDFLDGGRGGDLLDGGAGWDTATYAMSEGVTVDLADPGDNLGDARGDRYRSIEQISGSPEADSIYGDGSGNVIYGLEGDDRLDGRAGDDWLIGGPGRDRLDGGSGFDLAGYWEAWSGVKASLTAGGSKGEARGDTYVSIEHLVGSWHDDTLIGDAKSNFLEGLGGDDRLVGGDGDDLLIGHEGADRLDGGAGFDAASYAYSEKDLRIYLADSLRSTGEARGDTYLSIEYVVGTRLDDRLIGDDLDNWLEGGSGGDRIVGGQGFDWAAYEFSPDGVRIDLADPSRNTGDGIGDSYRLIEGLWGSPFADRLLGDDRDNTLAGIDGEDRLYGRAGDDLLDGGPGGDRLDGGDGHDIATHRDIDAGIVVDMLDSSKSTGEATGDIYESVEGAEGWSFDDDLRGRPDADDLRGLGGDDVLRGRDGDDVLNGGPGADLLIGGDGQDWADYSDTKVTGKRTVADLADPSANTREAKGDIYDRVEGLRGSDDRDTLRGDAESNSLEGLGGDDLLDGREGADRIDGGAGADRLLGGAGPDVFLFRTGNDLDRVLDFEDGDLVDLSGHDAASDFDALMATATEDAVGVSFALGGDLLTLVGVALADLGAEDFLF